MEKQIELKEVKSANVQCVVTGVSVLFCVLTAVFGFESLSIGGVMIFAVICVMGCLVKDWVELCSELIDED